MGKSLFSYLSLSVLVCVCFVYATDVDTGTLDIIVVDGESIQIAFPIPETHPIGTVGYDAHTGKLLFTTSLDADDPEILKNITGAGEYIIIRTRDTTWCTDLTLNECRRNADFIKETSLTIAPEPILVPVSDPGVETTLDILPTGEAVISYINAFPDASPGENIDITDIPLLTDVGDTAQTSEAETGEVISQPLENIQENQEVIVVPVEALETSDVSDNAPPSQESVQSIRHIDNHIADLPVPTIENLDNSESPTSLDTAILDDAPSDGANSAVENVIVPTDSPESDV